MLPIHSPLRHGSAAAALLLALSVWTGCAPSGQRSLQSGVRLLHQGQYASAIDKLKVASELLPQHAQVWNHLGLAYHGGRQPDNAIFAYQKALELNRDLAAARFNLGNVYLEQNNLRAAINELTIYTALQPMSVDGWVQLGTAQLRDRQWDAAEKSFSNALQLRKDHPPALNGLGLVQVQKKRPREAANFFNSASPPPPRAYAPALLNLAILSQQQLNNKAFALKKYYEYLSLKPLPPQWQTVDALARQLDQELNPPKPPAVLTPPPVAPTVSTQAVATGHPPVSVTLTNQPPGRGSITNPVAALLLTNRPPAFTNPPAIVRTNPPTVPLATNPPVTLVPTNPPVTIARVPEEAPIKPAQDNKREPPPVTPTPPPRPIATETNLAQEGTNVAGAAPKTSKTTVLDRVNPLNWRSGKTGGSPKVTPLGPGPSPQPTSTQTSSRPPVSEPPRVTSVSSNAIAPAKPTAPVVPPKVYPRFSYRHPAKPPAGNRQEAERFFPEALRAQRERRLARAIELYRAALRADPAFFDAYYNLGLAGYQAGDWGTALSSYELALTLEPGSANARYNFALALQKAGYPKDAADELTRLLTQGPPDARIYLTLGNLYARELAQPELAREMYLKLLEADPRHPEAAAVRFWLANHP